MIINKTPRPPKKKDSAQQHEKQMLRQAQSQLVNAPGAGGQNSDVHASW
jgi:hypothetical protein